MLRRAKSDRAPAVQCSRISSGKCLGCPNCLRTGWLDDDKPAKQAD